MKLRLIAPLVVATVFSALSTSQAVQLEPASAPASPVKPIRISEPASTLLKLSRGQVSEQVVLAYIENARRNFDLSADEIVYLKQERVSDKIVTAALNHHFKIPSPVVTYPQQTIYAPSPAVAQQPTVVVTQPQTTYVQAAPQPVYVYSYPAYSYYNPYPYYYSYYPYRYYGYYGHRYPTFSVNLGFGRGFSGGYHHSYHSGSAHNIGFRHGGYGAHGSIGGAFHGGHRR
jgi:hypothetical protein